MTATADNLKTYLGAGSDFDVDRATYLLGLATTLCESYVSPLPDAADAIVIAVAVRFYTNPQGLLQETAGPYNVQRPRSASLADDEIRALKRLAGRGSGAFSIDPAPDAVAPSDVVDWLDYGDAMPSERYDYSADDEWGTTS